MGKKLFYANLYNIFIATSSVLRVKVNTETVGFKFKTIRLLHDKPDDAVLLLGNRKTPNFRSFCLCPEGEKKSKRDLFRRRAWDETSVLFAHVSAAAVRPP